MWAGRQWPAPSSHCVCTPRSRIWEYDSSRNLCQFRTGERGDFPGCKSNSGEASIGPGDRELWGSCSGLAKSAGLEPTLSQCNCCGFAYEFSLRHRRRHRRRVNDLVSDPVEREAPAARSPAAAPLILRKCWWRRISQETQSASCVTFAHATAENCAGFGTIAVTIIVGPLGNCVAAGSNDLAGSRLGQERRNDAATRAKRRRVGPAQPLKAHRGCA
jgi:hypothetical protein